MSVEDLFQGGVFEMPVDHCEEGSSDVCSHATAERRVEPCYFSFSVSLSVFLCWLPHVLDTFRVSTGQ